jgi:anti-anti-sigma factor
MVVCVDQEGPEPVFAVSAEDEGDHLRVRVTGEVDMATAGSMTEAAGPPGARRVTLDLREVTFFDSAAIHALVRLAERFPDALTVLPSRQVRRVLEISGLAGQSWLSTP